MKSYVTYIVMSWFKVQRTHVFTVNNESKGGIAKTIKNKHTQLLAGGYIKYSQFLVIKICITQKK